MTAQQRNELRELATAMKWLAAMLFVGAGFTFPVWGILLGVL